MTEMEERTKQEIYDGIAATGRKLKALNKYTKQELLEIEAEVLSRQEGESQPEPQTEAVERPEPQKIGTLTFPSAGWCNELGRTYDAGVYRPKTLDEYNFLFPYSIEGGAK